MGIPTMTNLEESVSKMNRLIAYIDSFNLYFGLKESKWKKYYWLDLQKLCLNLTKYDQILVSTKYLFFISIPALLTPSSKTTYNALISF